jgi:hypothetical protein
MTNLSLQDLHLGQAVQVEHGLLKGIIGLLISFSANRNCRIELDTPTRGVVLVIDPAAVRPRKMAKAVTTFGTARAETT